MKINTQIELEEYEKRLRNRIYETIGAENFYKFESATTHLSYLDNNWIQLEVLSKVFKMKDIVEHSISDTSFTLITKDILGQYICNLHGEDNNEAYFKDIKLLENLYNSFDWNNDTLVFTYSY